jgi:hypothetical protein
VRRRFFAQSEKIPTPPAKAIQGNPGQKNGKAKEDAERVFPICRLEKNSNVYPVAKKTCSQDGAQSS